MPQTSGATSFRNCVIEISTNNTTWTDISGNFNKLKTKGPGRKTGAMNTGASDKPVLTVGKMGPLNLDVDIVYSESTTEAYSLVEGYFQNATPVYLRWAPKGTATGNLRFTTDAGYIEDCPLPAGDMDKADPVAVTFSFSAPGYTKATI